MFRLASFAVLYEMEFESKAIDGAVGGEGGVQEFQAVVFAPGSSPLLHPLTADASASPKTLLPVAGRPLLAYQLDLLAKAGFSGTPLKRSSCLLAVAL